MVFTAAVESSVKLPMNVAAVEIGNPPTVRLVEKLPDVAIKFVVVVVPVNVQLFVQPAPPDDVVQVVPLPVPFDANNCPAIPAEFELSCTSPKKLIELMAIKFPVEVTPATFNDVADVPWKSAAPLADSVVNFPVDLVLLPIGVPSIEPPRTNVEPLAWMLPLKVARASWYSFPVVVEPPMLAVVAISEPSMVIVSVAPTW